MITRAILWDDRLISEGRNGSFAQKGITWCFIDECGSELSHVYLRGINSKGLTARGSLCIPVSKLREFCSALEDSFVADSLEGTHE